MKSALHESLFSLEGQSNLEVGIETAVAQAAFTLPLPSPVLAEMVDTRAHRKQREYGDDINNRTLAPYDAFLTQLALLPPLRELVVDAADHLASDVNSCEALLHQLTSAPSFLASRTSAAFANLPSKSKHRLLVAERARAAAQVSPSWVTALNRWGFVRLGLLARMPPTELQAALVTACPITAPRGCTLAESRLCALANAIPAEGMAHALASVMAYWLAGSEAAQRKLHLQTSLFDARFQRAPIDPRSLLPH